jgi:transcriptional regulator with XRE-family HTH domain
MSWFRSTPESEAALAEERLVLSATEAVEEALARAGMNKQQLAELLKVRPTEISQRLSGRRNLTLRTLARMLHVLGMRAELTLKPALPAVSQTAEVAYREGPMTLAVLRFQPTEVSGHREFELPGAWREEAKLTVELFRRPPVAAAP